MSVPPALVADLVIVVAMIHDWHTRGRPHKVYAIGLPVVLAQQVSTAAFSRTAAWMGSAFERLAG